MAKIRMPAALLALAALLAACEGPTGTVVETDPAFSSLGAPFGCVNIAGTDIAQFTSPTTATGALHGDLQGTFDATILELRPTEDGSIHLVAERTIVNEHGTISTSDSGVLSHVEGSLYRANGQYTFVSGTGLYEDVSGGIRIHGDVDLGTGEVMLTYFGRICL